MPKKPYFPELPTEYERRSAAMKFAWQNPETRPAMIAGLEKGLNSPESLLKRSTTFRQLLSDPEWRRKYNVAIGTHDPTVREKQHETLMAHYAIDEWRHARWDKMKENGNTKKLPKFTDDEVREIRSLLADGFKIKEICEIFNVSQPIISYIKAGKTYKHVKDIA